MITSGKTPTPAHEQHGTTTPQAPVATDDRLLTAAEVAEAMASAQAEPESAHPELDEIISAFKESLGFEAFRA